MAYEKLVDSLLASPRHGERWGRHWLDVVRFAESNGYEMNQHRPNAWHYRDWVIRSFNNDIPYGQFIKEQLAGDQLGSPAATGFLVAGSWDQVKSPDPVLTANQRADELHDMISVTGSAFLGLTVGCARCHHHKFDPVKQPEYYGWKAVFEGVRHGESAIGPAASSTERLQALQQELAKAEEELARLEPLANPKANAPERLAVDPKGNRERIPPARARFLLFRVNATNTGTEPCLDEIEVFAPGGKENLALATKGVKASSSSNYQGSPLHKLEHINDGQFGNGRSWISAEAGKGWISLEFPKEIDIGLITWARDREGRYLDRLPVDYSISLGLAPDHWNIVASSSDRAPINKKGMTPVKQEGALAQLEKRKQELSKELLLLTSPLRAYAGNFENPPPTWRFHRGDPMQPKEQVSPASLRWLAKPFELVANAPEGARRIALANWITAQDNPLPWRVMANRLWHYHFGAGLVDTPSDLGVNGARPINQPLLDWLACELRDSGSIKALHRLICLSAAYQRAGTMEENNSRLDAGARYLWRFPPRRLEAEPIRDTLLALAGVLDQRLGGVGFDLFEPNTNYVKVYNPLADPGPETYRRMVYQSKPRMQLDSIFGAFDCPDAGQTAPRRTSSTTPVQALSLWNSPFANRMAERLAQRIREEAGPDPRKQVLLAFSLAYSRLPEADVEAASLALVEHFSLDSLCRALINANEFLFIE